MAISISENQGNSYNRLAVADLDWVYTPPGFYIPYTVGGAALPDFQVDVLYPAFDLFPVYVAFTDWQLELQAVNFFGAPWLKVNGALNIVTTLGVLTGSKYLKTLTMSPSNLGLLSAGNYATDILCKVTAINPETGLRETVSTDGACVIRLVAAGNWIDIPPFEATYFGDGFSLTTQHRIPLKFTHYIGAPAPDSKDIYFYPPHFDLEIDRPDELVTLRTNVNTYYGKIAVSFADVSAFALGTYTYTVTLSKPVGMGSIQKIIEVELTVIEDPDGFALNPESLTFNAFQGGSSPPPQTLSVTTGSVWNVVGPFPAWLQLSQYSGSGNATISVMMADLTGLATGAYIFPLTLTDGTNLATVNITMNFVAFLVNPFGFGKLYFTKDADFLKFASTSIATYIDLTIQVKTFLINTDESRLFSRDYSLPLFKGLGEIHIGTIVHSLLEEIEKLEDYVPAFEGAYLKVQYLPAEVLISFAEKNFTGAAESEYLVENTLPMFRMIKGFSPSLTKRQMGLLSITQQAFSRITPDSIVGFSFTHFGAPRLSIKKNGSMIDAVTALSFGTKSPKIIYSYFRVIDDVVPGDIIEVVVNDIVGSRTQRYLVFPPGVERTFFFFETHNGILEPFEFTGRRQINSNITHQVSPVYKNLFQYDRKAFSRNKQTMIVNTGQLMKEEHRIVNAIIASRKIYCSFDDYKGPFIEVDCTTTKIQPQDTSSSDESFDLEFTILENSDATVYPR